MDHINIADDKKTHRTVEHMPDHEQDVHHRESSAEKLNNSP